nr:MAG: RNA-dependent RNA polymerase [Riboviria sp.]WKV33828.1 MAG: RNA-dependent RNA polymerase [Riboviria sp.]
MYNAINAVFRERVVAKGLNPGQRGALILRKWQKYRRPVAVGLDASRFDQHVSVAALEWEHSIYNALFKDAELAELLRWQLFNRGVGYCGDGKVGYAKRGTRGSGDMNTSLGNVLLMCGMVHRFLEDKGISASFINDGDDCVLIMEEQELHKMKGLRDWFLRFGFSMKQEEPVRVFEQIEFCQSHPVMVGSNAIMVRNPRKAFGGDLVTLKARTLKEYSNHLTAVGVCGGVLSSGVPIHQGFYASMRRNGSGRILDIKKDVWLMGMGFTHMALLTDPSLVVNEVGIEARTRVSYWRAFGITPDQQLLVEAHYRSVTRATLLVDDKTGYLINNNKLKNKAISYIIKNGT